MKTKKDTVEVATTQVGYKFPTDHPRRKRDDGTEVYVIPVTYVDPEDTDFDVSETYSAEAMKQGVQDITQALKAGMRLAVGKAAKDAYAVEGGKKVLLQAVAWIATSPFLTEWAQFHKDGKPDKADELALTKYRAR